MEQDTQNQQEAQTQQGAAAEQIPALEALAKQAEAMSAEPEEAAQAAQQAHQVQAVDAKGEARFIVNLLAMGIEAVCPVLGYTEETKEQGAKVLAPVMEKYGLANSVFGRWQVEFEAGMFFVGLAVGSVKAYRDATDAEKEARKPQGGWWSKFFKRGEK